jgi:hypothetical protein
MMRIASEVQKLRERMAARTEQRRRADAERDAFLRVVNCPSCGDTNRDVLVDGIAICGCRHLYHAA